jgi:hypothetical protein
MNCTASPSLIDTLDPELRNRSSVFAEEGSAAHCLAELIVDEIATGRTEFSEDEMIGTTLRRDDETGD